MMINAIISLLVVIALLEAAGLYYHHRQVLLLIGLLREKEAALGLLKSGMGREMLRARIEQRLATYGAEHG